MKTVLIKLVAAASVRIDVVTMGGLITLVHVPAQFTYQRIDERTNPVLGPTGVTREVNSVNLSVRAMIN